MDRTRFGIVRAVDQTLDAGMQQGARTHGARFNCSKQLAVSKTVVAESGTRLAQGDDFRVGGGVEFGDVAVPASTDDASPADDNCADRYLSGLERALGGAQSFFHPEFVGGGCSGLCFCFRFQCCARRWENLRHFHHEDTEIRASQMQIDGKIKTTVVSSLCPGNILAACYGQG